MFQREEDISIDTIDFDWVEKCTNVKHLKRAIQILKQDGGYYEQLEKAILNKIEELNPDAKKNFTKQNVDPQTKKLVEEALYEWENELKEKEKEKQRARDGQRDNLFGGSSSQDGSFQALDEDTRKKLGENEKNKGNEAIKSGDLKEALQYYTKSIQFYDKISASYCNRALVYLKMKDFKSCIADCDKALKLDSKYSKAFHRKAKANFELGNYDQAVKDFQQVMTLEPQNSEVNAELMEARKKLGTSSKTLTKPGDFKKITIQEESESEEEDEEENTKEPTANSKGSEGTNKLEQLVDDMLLEEQRKNADSKFEKVEELKKKANELLQTGMYEPAISEYQKGLNILNDIKLSGAVNETEADLTNKKAVLFNNVAYCYMQMDLPDSVISYTSRIFDLNDVVSDTLVKAYLRRALAYEKIDKIVLALKDYENVKHLNPGNVTASEGLNRLHKMISKDEDLKKSLEKSRKQDAEKKKQQETEKTSSSKTEKTEAQPRTTQAKQNIEAELKRYEEEKLQGNNFFKDKNYAASKKAFYEVQTKIEEHFKQDLTQENRTALEKLYIQVTSNAAMCCFNLDEIDQSSDNCDKVLKIDPNHQKSLYRKALCKQKMGEKVDQNKDLPEIERKKKQLELYEEARKILENVLHVDNKNPDVKEKLSELIRVIVQLRIKYKLTETKQETKENKPPVEEESKKVDASPTEKKGPAKNPAPGLSKEYLNSVTTTAAKLITDDLINSKDIPQTSSKFETDCKGFKNNNDKLYFYVKKIPTDHLTNLYKDKMMPTDLALNIVSSVKTSGLSDDSGYCFNLLQAITKTGKFNLFVKQLTGSERKEIKTVLNEIGKAGAAPEKEINELLGKYNC